MPVRTRNVDDLILTIHSAALAPDGWGRIGHDLCRVFSANGASLVRPSRTATLKPWCHLFNFDAAFITEYMNQWGQHDVWYHGAVRARRLDVGLVNVDRQLIDRREFERSQFYNEFLRPMNIDRMMNVCLLALHRMGIMVRWLSAFTAGLERSRSRLKKRVCFPISHHILRQPPRTIGSRNPSGCSQALE